MYNELLIQRSKRIEESIKFANPDQVPVVLYFDFYAARSLKVSTSRFVEDPELKRNTVIQAFKKTGADGFMIGRLPTPFSFVSGGFPNRIMLPGRDLPENEMWQFLENKETILWDDYSTIANKGWKNFLPELLPRFTEFQPYMLPRIVEKEQEQGKADVKAWQKEGIPLLCGGAATPPFEILAAGRTMMRFYMDLKRYPQKVLAAMESMLPEIIEGALENAKIYGTPRIVITGNRSCGGLISLQDFETFALPFLQKMVEEFVSQGMGVMLHLDSDWTPNLPYFKDFPRGCILHTDGSTDIREASRVLKGHFVIKGDVPAVLLSTAPVEQVKNYCRELLEDMGTEGFILSSGCDVPMDAQPANVNALAEVAEEFCRE